MAIVDDMTNGLAKTGFFLSILPWLLFGAMAATMPGLGSLFGATGIVLCVALPPIALTVCVVAWFRKQSLDYILAGVVLSGVPVSFFLFVVARAIFYTWIAPS